MAMWVTSRLVVMVGLAGISLTTQAAPQLYQGMIGTLPVVAVQDATGDPRWRYFYARHRISIGLNPADGDCHAPQQCLQESDSWDRPVRWTLTPTADGGWAGVWQQTSEGTGKKTTPRSLPIRLRPLSPAALAAPAQGIGAQDRQWLQAHPYESVLLQGQTFKPVRQSIFQGKTLQWYRSPVNGAEHFLVQRGYDQATRDRLNTQLRQSAWQQIADWVSCAEMAPNRHEYDTTVTPRWLSADLVSVSRFTSYDCGGAHPDFGDHPFNFSLRLNRELSLEDVLWVDAGQPPRRFAAQPEGTEWQHYDAYRSQKLAPWLHRQLSQLYPRQMRGQSAQDYAYAVDDFTFPVWYMLPQGLYVSPSLARVARAAEYPEFTVIPWSLVRQQRRLLPLPLPH